MYSKIHLQTIQFLDVHGSFVEIFFVNSWEVFEKVTPSMTFVVPSKFGQIFGLVDMDQFIEKTNDILLSETFPFITIFAEVIPNVILKM